jgi:predicted nucleic acid-binding protein
VIVVVADTSPLNYLIQTNCDHVLPVLYERVFVPLAVVEELRHPRSAAAVRIWLARVPSWLVVQQVDEAPDAALARLDPGERQAIQLAKREHADLLLSMKDSASASHVNKGLLSQAPWAFCCRLPGAAWSTWSRP